MKKLESMKADGVNISTSKKRLSTEIEFLSIIHKKWGKDDDSFCLSAESPSMGYAAFLKEDYEDEDGEKQELLGFDLTYEQRAEIYEQYIWVELFRGFFLGTMCYYTLNEQDKFGKYTFLSKAPNGNGWILIARFLASLWMHF